MSGLSGKSGRVTGSTLQTVRNASTGSLKPSKARLLSERLRLDPSPPWSAWPKSAPIRPILKLSPIPAAARRLLGQAYEDASKPKSSAAPSKDMSPKDIYAAKKARKETKRLHKRPEAERLVSEDISSPQVEVTDERRQESHSPRSPWFSESKVTATEAGLSGKGADSPPLANATTKSDGDSFLAEAECPFHGDLSAAPIAPTLDVLEQTSSLEDPTSTWDQDNWGESGENDLVLREFDNPPRRVPSGPHPPMRLPISYTRRVEGLLEEELIDNPTLLDVAPNSKHRPVAVLAHGLERVLFNPGVHWMQDPRSGVYNFTPWLESIPKVEDFDFGRLDGFIPSSRDKDLIELARREKRKFAGSTSSLSGMLSHAYFLISGDKPVDLATLSRHYDDQSTSFTAGQRMPASVRMNYNEGVYTIDSDSITPGAAEKNILSWMGTLLEKFVTTTPEVFKTFLRANPPDPVDESDDRRDAYRYSKSNHVLMRSQLDCKDSRLPGTGVFDIKTRAVLPIRLDSLNHKANSGYLIRTQHGLLESFEKEYYDLIRAAFLKYSYQVRIGAMDGVMVAYHNTERIMGFQYISLEEMEQRLYGETPGVGDKVFDKVVNLVENVAIEAVNIFPHQSITCTFETLDNSGHMQVYVEPADWSGAHGELKPIALLDVTCDNYLGDRIVTGAEAMENTGVAPWTVHWTLKNLSIPYSHIRDNLAGTRKRQIFSTNLPEGVSMGEIEKLWTGLNYGGTASTFKDAFNARKFQHADRNIRKLRDLAIKGRLDTQARDRHPKIVWNAATADIPSFVEETTMPALEAELTQSEMHLVAEVPMAEEREASVQDEPTIEVFDTVRIIDSTQDADPEPQFAPSHIEPVAESTHSDSEATSESEPSEASDALAAETPTGVLRRRMFGGKK